MSCGIALAAFVMAMFFSSPSLTTLIGRRAWWPGHADQGGTGLRPGPERCAVRPDCWEEQD